MELDIILDRETPVYYAGEIVRGEVVLNTMSKSEKCRSLNLKFEGFSRCHWHTGSGNKRTDFDGKKLFQHTERTLWGDYYQTAVLEEAGADAIFGGALGDGVMYIPCHDHEGNDGQKPMHLIVRVRNYDCLKDDPLGEVVIDATELAMSGDCKVYSLSRNGKTEKTGATVTLAAQFVPEENLIPEDSTITFNSPPSDAVSFTPMEGGRRRRVVPQGVSQQKGVASCTKKSGQWLVLTVISANNLRSADWCVQNDVYVQAYRMPDDLSSLSRTKRLPGPNKSVILPQGKSTFPFAFPLRLDAPGSAYLDEGDISCIHYQLRANVKKALWRDNGIVSMIWVKPNRPIPTLELFKPFVHHTMDEQMYGCKASCMKCNNIGLACAKLCLDRTAYAPGETVDLSGSSITNDSNKPLRVYVTLRKYVWLQTTRCLKDFHAERKYSLRVSNEANDTKFEAICAAGETINFSSLPEGHHLRIPTITPSFFGTMGSFASIGEPIRWTYAIELSGKVMGGQGSKVKAFAPILISAAFPYKSVLEQIRGQPPTSRNYGPWDIEQYCLTGIQPCDNCPELTGFEDFFAFEDDPLSPMDDNLLNEFIEIFTGDTSANAGTPDEPEIHLEHALSKLMENLDLETDKRMTVGKWTMKHPAAAASLTPDHVRRILAKVTFSFEQGAVAKEIAAGPLGRQKKLTCAHVMSAIETCPYKKAEVARAMGPYVNDPQNKDALLEQIPSFERETVQNCFRI